MRTVIIGVSVFWLYRFFLFFFFSSRRRHTRFDCDWSLDVCSSDLAGPVPLHLCGRREIDVDLGAAPDGAGPDPRDAGDDADGFLDGPRHAEQLLARAQRGPGRHDRDAGEVELWVDGRGKRRGGPHAPDTDQRHEQINEAALAAQDVEQRHRGGGGAAVRTILAPSATPYAPLVTTTSPAW